MVPNIWTVIAYSCGCSSVLPSHQRNLKESWSCSLTLTWWNKLSISATIAVWSCRNLSRTPTRLLIQSGPCIRLLLREVPPYSEVASNTIRTFPGLLGLSTGKCGKYHVLGPVTAASSGVSLPLCNVLFNRHSILFSQDLGHERISVSGWKAFLLPRICCLVA